MPSRKLEGNVSVQTVPKGKGRQVRSQNTHSPGPLQMGCGRPRSMFRCHLLVDTGMGGCSLSSLRHCGFHFV